MKTRILPFLLLTTLLLSACAAPSVMALPLAGGPLETQPPQESSVPSGPDSASLETALASCDGFAFPQNDGVRYWLDTADGLKLHGWMISGDPTYYETFYTANLETAEFSDGSLRVVQLLDAHGFPLQSVRELRFAFAEDGVTMSADVDESKLAGGAGDNILDGEYRFVPWDRPHTPPAVLTAREPFGELIFPANGYASLSNGAVLFWLESSDGLKLHWHPAGQTSDRVYTLNPEKSSRHGDWISSVELLDGEGKPVPGLRTLSFFFRENSVLMSVTMDPNLSGDAESVLPGGRFLFTPYTGSYYISQFLDGKQPEVSAYDGYTCMRGDEVLFWLESSGARLNLTLHCFFENGTARYERVWHIDSEKAFFRGNELIVEDLFDREENSVWQDGYSALSFRFGEGMVLMHVVQAAKPPAGAEDLIPTGDYLFTRSGSSASGTAKDVPVFDSDELVLAARDYYERHNGFRPPEGEASYQGDGLWLIHLYEIVTLEGTGHTATSAWYTVNEHGVGVDFFDEPVDFSR